MDAVLVPRIKQREAFSPFPLGQFGKEAEKEKIGSKVGLFRLTEEIPPYSVPQPVTPFSSLGFAFAFPFIFICMKTFFGVLEWTQIGKNGQKRDNTQSRVVSLKCSQVVDSLDLSRWK